MMNRKEFIGLLSTLAISTKVLGKKSSIEIEFMRHATFILSVGGLRILVDPMLSGKHEMDPVGNAPRSERIPMVALPFSDSELNEKLQHIDAFLVTHTHRDHWDVKAQSILNKEIPLICQPPDTDKLEQQGFTNVIVANNDVDFKGLKIHRTNGQHGTGEVGTRMGPVSGFIVSHEKKKIYIAGDSVWGSEVESAITTHKPDVIVVNAGAAQFNEGDPITMTSKDVIKTINTLRSAKVVAVHMETVNHCRLTKSDLKKDLERESLLKSCLIPADGETIHLE